MTHNPLLSTPVDLLASLPLFTSLSAGELTALASVVRVSTYARGVFVFTEGEHGGGFHILVQGLIKLCHVTADGREAVLHLIRPGNMFGEAAVFQDGAYPASAVVVEEARTLFLPTSPLKQLIAANPELALRMLGALSLRLRMFTRKLESMTTRDASQRLAAYLLHRSRLQGQTEQLKLDVSREVLASMLGTARETISRVFSRLADTGIITLKGRTLCIMDLARLQQVADKGLGEGLI